MSERDWTRRPAAAPGQQEDPERSSGELDRMRMAMAMRRRQQQRQQQSEVVPQTSGAPLDAGLRANMEGQLGADLSDVRVHNGSESAAAANKLGARAFTSDKDVHFGAGEYAPGTKEGDRLIAHELAHVAQGKAAGAVARKATSDDAREGIAAPHDATEREADEAADAVAGALHGGGGRKITLSARASGGIHRKAKPDAEAVPDDAAHAGAEPGPKDGKKDAAKDFSKMSDDERWKSVQDFIKASPTGQHALDQQKKYSIAIKWQPGGGSYYDAGSKSMVLDSALNAEQVALNFVHEMNHAEFDKEGEGAHGKDKNISTMSREEYVVAMLDEEVKGTCLSIETKMELEAAGQKVASKYPLEDEYRAAYEKATGGKKKEAPIEPAKDAKKDAEPTGTGDKAETPKGDPAKKSAGGSGLDAAGKKAGYDAVLKGFKDGLVTTSNTGEKYPDYYGKAWDKANKGKKK
jgi:hypothetical protein